METNNIILHVCCNIESIKIYVKLQLAYLLLNLKFSHLTVWMQVKQQSVRQFVSNGKDGSKTQQR